MLNGVTWQNALGLTIVVIMCGFIAYWGDLLGRRMGKRRLSFLGLRPKYTAIAVTTVNGMLIAILTICVMAGVSQRVRLLMLKGFEIVSERKAMERQLKATKHAYDVVAHRLGDEEIAEANARKEAFAAKKSLDSIVAEKRRLTLALASLHKDLQANRAALAHASAQLAREEGDLKLARQEILERRRQIDKQKTSIAELEEKRKALVQISRDLAEGTKQAMTRLRAMQSREIAFRSGDELSRGIIQCSLSKAEIRKHILQIIDQADKHARQDGVGVGENGRAVKILPLEFEGKKISESDVIEAISDNIASGKGSVVARVITLSNTVEDDQPALVDIALNPNKLTYKSGDEVASTQVDGKQPRGHIFGVLVQFFKTKVRAAAIRQGVIPCSDDEGQLSVGQIPGDMLMDMVDRIKATGQPVTVHAVVAKDTWSADTLVLDLPVDTVR